MPPSVVLILASGFEEIEAVTIIDILRRGEVTVVVAGITKEPIVGNSGIVVVPDVQIEDIDASEYDMIVLPGGLKGVDNIINDQALLQLIQQMYRDKKFIAAICAAPKILAHLDIIKDKNVTSYPSEKETVAKQAKAYLEDNVVIDGNIITSRGPGTAMIFALTLLVIVAGDEIKNTVGKGILFYP